MKNAPVRVDHLSSISLPQQLDQARVAQRCWESRSCGVECLPNIRVPIMHRGRFDTHKGHYVILTPLPKMSHRRQVQIPPLTAAAQII
jgi:hypothetical protein